MLWRRLRPAKVFFSQVGSSVDELPDAQRVGMLLVASETATGVALEQAAGMQNLFVKDWTMPRSVSDPAAKNRASVSACVSNGLCCGGKPRQRI